MRNLIIERVVKVSLYLTAEQWQLYNTDSAVASGIAMAMNKNIAEYVNRGECRERTEQITLSLMRHNAEYGAYDSEPIAVLSQILDEIYGVEL